MESIIKDAPIALLLENDLIGNCQHGYFRGRTVQRQLKSLIKHWTDKWDSGRTIDVDYLNVKKAIDSVPHISLLPKLHSYGFPDKLLGWIKSFSIG